MCFQLLCMVGAKFTVIQWTWVYRQTLVSLCLENMLPYIFMGVASVRAVRALVWFGSNVNAHVPSQVSTVDGFIRTIFTGEIAFSCVCPLVSCQLLLGFPCITTSVTQVRPLIGVDTIMQLQCTFGGKSQSAAFVTALEIFALMDFHMLLQHPHFYKLFVAMWTSGAVSLGCMSSQVMNAQVVLS